MPLPPSPLSPPPPLPAWGARAPSANLSHSPRTRPSATLSPRAGRGFSITITVTMRHPGLDIVAIGGGTGLSTLLRGLKRYVDADGAWSVRSLGAIVTVTDEGGSSGVLRKELGMLPPGDIRNCIVP